MLIEDAITSELIRSALMVAVEEASINVVRAAHSTWIQEGADAAAALLDEQGQLVAQSDATTPQHVASLRGGLRCLLDEVPLEEMDEGDVFAFNDPYRGGIHANDILVFRPTYHGGRLVYFAATVVHVADLGGVAAAGIATLATDTFAEGVTLPPVRLYRRNEPQPDIFAIIAANSRSPGKVVGDVKALVAGTNTIARRVEELIDRFGADTLRAHVDALLDYSERRVREGLRRLPDGIYEACFTMEEDGIEPGRTFDVRATVHMHDGSVDIDFAGTSAQSAGAINSARSQTTSGVLCGLRCFLDATIPMNEGCFRPVTIHLPSHSLVNPDPPAACGSRVGTVAAVADVVIAALSQSVPGHRVAPSGLIHVFTLRGRREDGSVWFHMFYDFGGLGGREGSDGPDATGLIFLGGRSVVPQIEPLEALYPIRVRTVRLLPDSGGPGRWRGGLGMEMQIEMLGEGSASFRADRVLIPPAGVDGGAAGRAGSFAVRRAGGSEEVVLGVRSHDVRLGAGDVLIVRTTGGGGVGPADERRSELVAADLRDSKVTTDGVAQGYGPDLVDGATRGLALAGASQDEGGAR